MLYRLQYVGNSIQKTNTSSEIFNRKSIKTKLGEKYPRNKALTYSRITQAFEEAPTHPHLFLLCFKGK